MSGSNPRNAEAVHDQGPLDATDLDADPIAQLRVWLADAERSRLVLPNAMALATLGADRSPARPGAALPSAVALAAGGAVGSRSASRVFPPPFAQAAIACYANRTSRKARELAADPRAACTLYWRELDRQVCLRGDVTALSGDE